jgi:hypothetical protein
MITVSDLFFQRSHLWGQAPKPPVSLRSKHGHKQRIKRIEVSKILERSEAGDLGETSKNGSLGLFLLMGRFGVTDRLQCLR